MVLTPSIVFAQTNGIESVLLDHTHTRGPSVARMWDFYYDITGLCRPSQKIPPCSCKCPTYKCLPLGHQGFYVANVAILGVKHTALAVTR